MPGDAIFDDVLAANEEYAQGFRHERLEPLAARGLAVLTCMDSRIEPLAMLGLRPGDAKILRNAGARITDDVLRTLVLASYLLGVRRVMVITHTDCRMTGTEDDVHAAVLDEGGPDTRSLAFLMADRPRRAPHKRNHESTDADVRDPASGRPDRRRDGDELQGRTLRRADALLGSAGCDRADRAGHDRARQALALDLSS